MRAAGTPMPTPVDVSSVNLSLGNLAAAQMMSGATAQAAAATSTDAGAASGAAGVAVDVLAMELRAQRSLVDILA
jgi:hypothetical protein